jgi:hypothetical protein
VETDPLMATLRLARELTVELMGWCDDPIHGDQLEMLDDQILRLKALWESYR